MNPSTEFVIVRSHYENHRLLTFCGALSVLRRTAHTASEYASASPLPLPEWMSFRLTVLEVNLQVQVVEILARRLHLCKSINIWEAWFTRVTHLYRGTPSESYSTRGGTRKCVLSRYSGLISSAASSGREEGVRSRPCSTSSTL